MRSKDNPRTCGGNGRIQSNVLKDEVYRQMFRFEAGHPGAAEQLAIALLRAWMALEVSPGATADRMWLRKICPICIDLFEGSGNSAQTSGGMQRLI